MPLAWRQEGLNAWWGCFLTKIPKAGGGYSYNDISAKDPGEEHEGQCVSRPTTISARAKHADLTGCIVRQEGA